MAGRKGATFGGVSDRWPLFLLGRNGGAVPLHCSSPPVAPVGAWRWAEPPSRATAKIPYTAATSGGFLGMMVWGQEAVR